ncbi:chemotaxis protein CheA [Chromobacterium subtsugae]|uniref:Chemotaxis protein CheA n=2 Tax=Chromobacterium subtsugae TaxID=251747 RepID=A0ABS7FDB1_9NEIS|nr:MULTISPECIES: chemotaxis protein CheA [Chromobacterium]KUM05108.1 chemotaxis protein CheA [Chromobacterium subtsugae]KZE88165.1 chemotaxis protein CheA [Chromobacterium sp. F49]MBW7565661.1 chemotaxis protein CheA [Chromobacterium subtsugae]MBW8287992.1 chemotaxis protein CheA [Chromobacterium subtsugae]WSE89759.1 chemotaxis protein CheA [Chromobacterium subtsugae]
MDLSKAKAVFFEESRELCDGLETALLDPVAYPPNAETYNLLFRTAHTIKGSAGIFGLDALVRFAHVVENVLERLRSGQVALSDDLIGLLLSCNDHLRRLLDSASVSDDMARQDLPEGEPLLLSLRRYQDGEAVETDAQAEGAAPPAAAASESVATQTPYWQLSLRFHADTFRHGFDPLSFLRYLAGCGTVLQAEPVWRNWPPLPLFDATECFMGLDLSLESAESPERIAGTFEFIAEDSLIGILPPHASLADFLALAERLGEPLDEQLARWLRRGALTEAEAARIERGDLGQPEPESETAAVLEGPAPASTAAQPAGGAPSKPGRGDGQYIRIEAGKLDRLINRVGELVIASSGTKLIAQARGDAELLESVAVINTLVESIRDDALTLRMVPVDEIFSRFPRMVREVSKQLGKTIHLEIKGGDTEIDKSMVEKLTDPLMHIVRNAVDHGLESADKRLAAGKPAEGTVTLNAYHDAGSVVVEVKDDGGGINREKVLAKAVERGLVAEGRVLSDQETLQLIFLPGFSTAEAVSDLSGRGVGMDVVKRNIESLRGEIEIQSQPGLGSTFRLRLPLTLAIIDGFRVEVNESALVMPLDMMIECVDMPPGAMSQRARQVNLRGDWLPFVSLRELFGLPPSGQPEYIVIVHYGEHRAGIVVDRLMGEVQAVIKPLGEIFKSLRGISGSTILGNGKPALVLDIPQLIHHACRRERRLIKQGTEAATHWD